ncbi:MAG TPA: hypothetical protein VGE74_25360 [Gemmata sp.]
MTFGMVVRLPVTGTFGTDEEFDLRARLERDFNSALIAERAGECGLGETEAGVTSVYLETVTEPSNALRIVQGVLARHNLLNRATVLLETPSEDDPDDIERRVLWPVAQPSARVA